MAMMLHPEVPDMFAHSTQERQHFGGFGGIRLRAPFTRPYRHEMMGFGARPKEESRASTRLSTDRDRRSVTTVGGSRALRERPRAVAMISSFCRPGNGTGPVSACAPTAPSWARGGR